MFDVATPKKWKQFAWINGSGRCASYKTRSDAADACRGSAVRVNQIIAKPSANVRIGDTIVARTKAMTRTLYVDRLNRETGRRSTGRRVLQRIAPRRKRSTKHSKSVPTPDSSNTKAAAAPPRKTVVKLKSYSAPTITTGKRSVRRRQTHAVAVAQPPVLRRRHNHRRVNTETATDIVEALTRWSQ